MRKILSLLLCCFLLLPGAALAGEEAATIIYLEDGEPRPAVPAEDLLEVHFINVATADCALIRLGDTTLMIDSGRRSTSDRIFSYLESIGVDHLDYAFLSHPHDDHLGGFTDVLAEIPTDVFLLPACFEGFSDSAAQALWDVLAEQEIPVLQIETGYTLFFEGATLTFYQWPQEGEADNNRSMITLLRYGERTILFAADVENRGQQSLAEAYGSDLSADILKMPHHGLASYMREFHDAVQPSLALFTNTKSNIENTLSQVKARGVDWRLVTKGPIVLVTDGEQWQTWQIPNDSLQK